ncbi:hypothetical protein SAMN06297422_11944 [Lachnospiraceae bacterium]|nr:hypothetical protein SAMN06297422_11944 [Lachnospiraceae bacterium]
MDNIYKYLNDVDTDLSEFEEEQLSEIEIKRINKRLKGKMDSHNGSSSKKTMIWVGRAAAIVLCCLTVGGGAYAAAFYRKNTRDDLRIKASESKVVSEDGNKVTKEIYDDETGGKITYDVVNETADDAVLEETADGDIKLVEKVEKAGFANAEITSISKEGETLKIGVKFNFEKDPGLEALKEKIDKYSVEGEYWNATEDTGISLKTKIADREMVCWGNDSKIEENSLYLDFFVLSKTPEDYSDDENVPKRDTPLTADAPQEEFDAWFKEWEEYEKTLPDPLNSTIEVSIDLGKDYGDTYTFTTKLEGNYEESDRELISVNGGSGEYTLDGIYEYMSIDSYSMGATGLQFHGTTICKDDWDIINKTCEEQGIEYCGFLRIKAWDDLGNTYLMYMCNEPGDGSEKDTPYGKAPVDRFFAPLYDNAIALETFSKETGITYSSEWADGISQITFAIEKVIDMDDADGKSTTTVELVSEPVTINIPQ